MSKKKKYQVRIKQSFIRTFTVFADSREEAEDKAHASNSLLWVRHWTPRDKRRTLSIKEIAEESR